MVSPGIFKNYRTDIAIRMPRKKGLRNNAVDTEEYKKYLEDIKGRRFKPESWD